MMLHARKKDTQIMLTVNCLEKIYDFWNISEFRAEKKEETYIPLYLFVFNLKIIMLIKVMHKKPSHTSHQPEIKPGIYVWCYMTFNLNLFW